MRLDPMQNPIANDKWPISERGQDKSVLTSIYEDRINIAIWQRKRRQVLDLYAKKWVDHYPSHTFSLLLSVKKSA